MTLLSVMEQHCVRHAAVTHEVGKNSNEDKLPENNPKRSLDMKRRSAIDDPCMCVRACVRAWVCACMCGA